MSRYKNVITGQFVTVKGEYKDCVAYRKDRPVYFAKMENGKERKTQKRNFVKPSYVFFNTHIAVEK